MGRNLKDLWDSYQVSKLEHESNRAELFRAIDEAVKAGRSLNSIAVELEANQSVLYKGLQVFRRSQK